MPDPVITKFRDNAEKLKKKPAAWKAFLPELHQDIPRFRNAILEMYRANPESAMKEIATIDALATLPVFLKILEDIKTDNDKKLEGLFSEKLNINLVRSSVNINEKNAADNTVDHFKPLIDKEIASTFEEFILNEITEKKNLNIVLTKLTQEEVNKKIGGLIDDFLHVLANKNSSARKAIEENKTKIIALLRMEVFIICIMKAFIGADNAQKMDGLWEKGKFYAKYLYGTQLQKPFIALPLCMDGIEIPEDTNELWHELNLYLKAFYLRVHMLMKAKHPKLCKHEFPSFNEDDFLPLDDGSFATVDDDDVDIKKNFQKLTKARMVRHYATVVARIEPHLKSLKDVPKLEQKSLAKLQTFFPVETRPKDDAHLVNCLKDFLASGSREPFEKISELRNYVVCTVPFTCNIALKLMSIRSKIVTICESYTRYDGTLWRVYKKEWESQHSKLAKKLVTETDGLDPQLQLRKLYELRDQLVEKHSRKFRKKIDETLLWAFNEIVEGIPEQLYPEKKQIANNKK